ncbi:MAG: hypothetical protein IJG63_01800 [Oscillospiraceae bacterium]|nr:hypothetical protein [Oscillospiraceae bacterium]
MGLGRYLLWFAFGGIIMGISWIIAGLIWAVSIIGMPMGTQCFNISKYCFMPFGKTVRNDGGGSVMEYNNPLVGDKNWGSGADVPLALRIVWLIIPGVFLALEAAVIGVLQCVTLIGIPFGKKSFKIAKLALNPFGAAFSEE